MVAPASQSITIGFYRSSKKFQIEKKEISEEVKKSLIT